MNLRGRLPDIHRAVRSKGFLTFQELNEFLPAGEIGEAEMGQLLDLLDAEKVPVYNSEREYLHFKRRKRKKKAPKQAPRPEYKDPVNRYLQQMDHIERMEEAERNELVRELQELYARRSGANGDIEKRITEKQNRLVQGHIRLVVFLARKYTNRGVEYVDLIQEGNSGLVRAVRKYHYRNPDELVPFIINHVKEALLNAVYRLSGSLALSKSDNRELKKLSTQYGKLEQFVEITNHDDAKREERIVVSRRIKDTMDIKRMRSLDQPVYDGELSKLSDYIVDDSVRNQVETLIQQENTEVVHEKLKALTPPEQQIIILRYGIKSNVYKTWKEIAGRLGITVKKAMNIEVRALRKLKKLLSPRG